MMKTDRRILQVSVLRGRRLQAYRLDTSPRARKRSRKELLLGVLEMYECMFIGQPIG